MIEQEELAKEVAAQFQVLQDGIRDAFEGMTYGTKEADTPTFVKWFELKVQEPYWIDAMATFPEGRRMIKRYNEAKAKEYEAVGYGA